MKPIKNGESLATSNGTGGPPPVSVSSSQGGPLHDVIQLAKRSALANIENSAPPDPWMQEHFPSVYAILCWRDVDENSVKERARLSFRIDRGSYVVSISDTYFAGSLSASGGTFQEALKALDRLLLNPDQEWIHWKGKEPGKKVIKRSKKEA